MIIKKIKVRIRSQEGVVKSGNIIDSNYEKDFLFHGFGAGIKSFSEKINNLFNRESRQNILDIKSKPAPA